MVKSARNIVTGLLIMTLCVPTNVMAEGINEASDNNQMNTVLVQDEKNDLEVSKEEEGSEKQDDSKEQDASEDQGGSEEQGGLDDSDNSETSEEPQEPEWKKGWNEYEGNWYYCKEGNTLYSGWIKLNSKWYYLDGSNEEHPGIMACNEVKKIGNSYYVFDGNGVMQTGWVKRSEGWYYANNSGALVSGWMKSKGKWYYLDPSNETYPLLMKSNGIMTIKGQTYSFDGSGAMQTGWVKRPEGWYYANNSGALVSGWVKSKGKWYYLDPANESYSLLMKSNGFATVGGKTYCFDGNGAMQTGWIKRPEGWYYANRAGDLVSGWKKIGNKWYYFDPSNEEYPYLMVRNEKREIDGLEYIFEDNGAMKSGWDLVDGNWYYYDTNSGQKVAGWKFINKYWYYFYEDEEKYGVMAKSTVIDGYVLHENGEYVRSRNKMGWQNPSGYPQVSSMTVTLPGYCNGYFTYVTPSRISINATKQECIDAFIARAYEYMGTRYIEPWSSRPGDAVDCSGLVLQCLYATGMDLGIYNPYNHRWLPSQTYNSMNWYRNNTFMPVSTNAIQRGDLIYYKGHVAIYLGNGQIIDSWPGQGVSIKPIGSRGKVIGAARPFV